MQPFTPTLPAAPDWHDLFEIYQRALADINVPGDMHDIELNFLSDALCTAEKAIFVAPAPDGEVLARKLEIYFAEEMWEKMPEWQADVKVALIADARRLGFAGASARAT